MTIALPVWYVSPAERKGKNAALRRFKLPLTFILLALLGFTPSWGAMLCISDEGHHVVEFVFGCELDDLENACAAEAKDAPCISCDDKTDSSGCTDVPIAVATAPHRCQLQQKFHSHLSNASLPTGEISFAHFSVKTGCPSTWHHTSNIETTTLLSIASVVLRV